MGGGPSAPLHGGAHFEGPPRPHGTRGVSDFFPHPGLPLAPRWHDGRWWVSDFYRNAVYAIAPDGRAEEAVHLGDAEPSGLGWLPDGSLLIVSKKDHRILRQAPGGELEVHAELGEYCGGDLN